MKEFEYSLSELAAGRPDNAEQVLLRLLQSGSRDAPLLLALGHVRRQQGKPAEAIALYQEVLGLEADHPDALYQLAMTLKESGRLDLAEQQFRRLLERHPDHAEGLTGFGVILAGKGQVEQALPWLARAVEVRPDFAQARLNLGVGLGMLDRADEARVELEAALRLRPDYPEAYYNLGNILNVLGRPHAAVVMLRQALRLRSPYAAALDNLVLTLFKLGRFEEAEACLLDALRDQPTRASLHADLGTVLQMTGRVTEAIASFDLALMLDPHCVPAHYNRGTTLLSLGEWSEGWPGYEHRWGLDGAITRPHDRPAWNGSSLRGKMILVWVEQGLGDMIQFVRFTAALKAAGANVVLECPPHMVALFRSAPGIDRIITEGDPMPAYDVHAPLLSLPRLLGTTLENLPAAAPYLHVDDEQVSRWRKCLAAHDGLKIAIAWQGSRNYKIDQQRSIALRHFEPIARIPGVRLISLQKNFGAEQIAEVRQRMPIVELGAFDDEGAFLDSAAIMANVDLVICSDSSLAHLAGALGRPVWVALPFAPDWRWLRGRDDSPWYPTMRLFRQHSPGNWEPVFERLASEVARVFPRSSGS